jgi:hypothetical protein
MSDLDVKCPNCGRAVTHMKRFHAEVEYTRDPKAGTWELCTWDRGTHFHVFCEGECELKLWGGQLPEQLAMLAYPGDPPRGRFIWTEAQRGGDA